MVGDVETSCTVTVTKPAVPPTFTSLLRSAEVVLSKCFILEGKVTGHPTPTITWLKNEQKFLPDGNRVKSIVKPDGTFALIFEKSCTDDKGTYTAVAESDEGSVARCNAKIAIISDGEKVSTIQYDAKIFTKNANIFLAKYVLCFKHY